MVQDVLSYRFPSHQTFVSMKTFWRRLEVLFRLRLQKTSSGRLDQGEYICLTHTSSEDVFKTSSGHLDQDHYIRLGHLSSRCLQDVFQKRLQDMFKTSSSCFEDVFKTSSRPLCKNILKTSSRRLQDIFKMSCKDVFKTFSRRIISLNWKDLRSHFREIYSQCRKFASVIKIYQVLA